MESEGVLDRAIPLNDKLLSLMSSVKKRVYLGGINEVVTEAELLNRFKSFGEVQNVEIRPIFVHFYLDCSDEQQWKKCVSAYRGTSWKGGRLRLEEANSLSQSVEKGAEDEEKSKKRKRHLIRERGDIATPMSDAMATKRVGWKKGRFGRAVAVMRMRKPDGRLVTIDPTQYKNNIERLFGSERPRPLSQLTWSLQEDSEKLEDSSTDEENQSADEAFNQALSTELLTQQDLSESELMLAEAKELVESLEKTDLEGLDAVKGTSEQLIEGAVESGFSLGRMFGLPQVAEETPSVPMERASEEELIILKPVHPLLNPADLLITNDLLESLSANDIAFCRRTGKDEAFTLWRESRASLRLDFKQRIKQVKKMDRRKGNRSSLNLDNHTAIN